MDTLAELNTRQKRWVNKTFNLRNGLVSEKLYLEGEAIGRVAERMGFVFNEVTRQFEAS